MFRIIVRLIGLCVALAVLGYGIFHEKHEVKSFMNDEVETVDGPSFTKDSTIDRFTRHDDAVFDGHGLTPEPIKECPT